MADEAAAYRLIRYEDLFLGDPTQATATARDLLSALDIPSTEAPPIPGSQRLNPGRVGRVPGWTEMHENDRRRIISICGPSWNASAMTPAPPPSGPAVPAGRRRGGRRLLVSVLVSAALLAAVVSIIDTAARQAVADQTSGPGLMLAGASFALLYAILAWCLAWALWPARRADAGTSVRRFHPARLPAGRAAGTAGRLVIPEADLRHRLAPFGGRWTKR